MIATVKIIPFAVSREMHERALAAAQQSIRVVPYRIKRVAIISTQLPGLAPKVIEKTMRVTAERLKPAGADIVFECSGAFRTRAGLDPYFERGVKKVIVAAPVKEEVLNVVMGINHQLYDPGRDDIVTAASCTTNCLAPVVKVVQETLGIKHGVITTIHDVTNTQNLLDAPHKDPRRARSALLSLIPTSTGSATAIGLIYPELQGKLSGIAVRLPLLNASLTDCVFEVERETRLGAVHAEVEALRHEQLRLARAEVREQRDRWQQTLEQEKDSFLRELRVRVGQESVAMMRLALRELAGEDLDDRLVTRFLERLQTMDPSERDQLIAAAREDGGILHLTTALPASDAQRAQIGAALADIFEDEAAEVLFDTNPQLVAGVELRGGGVKVAWTVDDYLHTVEEALRDIFPVAASGGGVVDVAD